MTLLQAAVLGLVQGVAAFLPVSSTAHLRILPVLFGWHFYGGTSSDPGAAFTAVVRLGSTLALITYFWRELLHVSVAWGRGLYDRSVRRSLEYRMGWYLIGVTVPLAVLGLVCDDQIESGENDLRLLAGALIVVGALLWLAERFARRRRVEEQLNSADAVAVGVAQVLALVPGASRAGTAMAAGLFRGLDRPTAVRFAFLLSIPWVVLFSIYTAARIGSRHEHSPGSGLIGVGVVVSFVVGLISVHWLVRWVQRHSLLVFAYYRIGFGLLVLGLLAGGVIAGKAV
jgi:undecaprenyl-diphosphatase